MRLDHLLSKEEVRVVVYYVVIRVRSETAVKSVEGLLVAMRLGETPVPIPNTMVKP